VYLVSGGVAWWNEGAKRSDEGICVILSIA